jgi:predicted Zn-dependent protease
VVLLVILLFIAGVWGLYRGVSHFKTWMAGKPLAGLPNLSSLRLPDLPGTQLAGLPALDIPLRWERKLGEAGLAQVQAQTPFLNNPRVLNPLHALAAPLLGSVSDSTYRFTLFVSESREINACALPGGFIVFNRGLLERARTPEEIQGVLAHEMAHVLKRHGVFQLAKDIGTDLAVQTLQGNESPMVDAMIRNASQLLSMKFSRDQERAADDLGWDLLEKARIDPRGMVSFFSTLKSGMDSKGSGGLAETVNLLSTHPTPQERIDRLQRKAMALGTREFGSYRAEFTALQSGLGGVTGTR